MFWSKARRREKVRARAFPEAWEAALRDNVPYYGFLPPEDQAELRGHIHVLIGEKNFEGCGGLTITDEVKVTIAGYASILLLHRDAAYYPRLSSILVYPDAFVARQEFVEFGDDMDVMDDEDVRIGESWDTGAIVLAWKPIMQSAKGQGSTQNVALHEFAHQLDLEDGITNGVPDLDDDEAYDDWVRVMGGAYEALWKDIERNRLTFIDEYGATHPAEFFAVLTETFFMRPHTLQRKHADVYGVLREYYRQDPAALLPKV
ncbi:MAG: zinc-dependent peptidase [Candidatus Hydrogenedentes bacterium]|nr:zinc-dependent peptidase [Candidatus Hydrogenedentota bacterium]